jgi:hypothetical protein
MLTAVTMLINIGRFLCLAYTVIIRLVSWFRSHMGGINSSTPLASGTVVESRGQPLAGHPKLDTGAGVQFLANCGKGQSFFKILVG